MVVDEKILQASHGVISAEAMLLGQQEVLELIAKGASLQETLGAIARFAEQHIPGMRASILYFDPNEQKLRRGGYGKLPSSFADIVDGLVPGPKAGSCGTCAWRRHRVISEDVFTDPLWDGFHDLCRAYDIRSAWSSPLLSSADESLLGVFGMYHPEVRVPTVADLQIVDQFTHLATIATQRHRMDEMQRYRAQHDALTNLLNRYGLMSGVDALIQEHLSNNTPLSIVFIDLDSFKAFNDAFGHIEGDQMLRNVCSIMQTTLPDVRLLTRFGGDEFLVFLPVTTEIAVQQLNLLRNTFAKGVSISGQKLPVNFSAGVMAVTAQGHDIETLIFEADEAVRESKSLGGGHTLVVDADRAMRAAVRRGLSKRIEAALDGGKLYPHAQPIVQLTDEQVVGYELLFRLNDPLLLGVPVIECIAEAERVGLIHRIGSMMFQAGVDFLKQPAIQHSRAYVSINVSVSQLLQPDLAENFIAIVRKAGVDTRRICIEVTESAKIETGSPARASIKQLKSAGFKLAIDDFGTGYASLGHLQSLPFDVLKIDRQFVSMLDQPNVTYSKRQSLLAALLPDLRVEKVTKTDSMCSALIAMAKACDMLVVAEGIETKTQAQMLRQLGCHMGQGYLWARPAPLETFLK
jgi:diguanylate cyclase (GGDEF)-like protein